MSISIYSRHPAKQTDNGTWHDHADDRTDRKSSPTVSDNRQLPNSHEEYVETLTDMLTEFTGPSS